MSKPTSPPPSTLPSARPARAPSPLVTLVLGIRFLTELALIAAVAWAGAARTRSIPLAIGLGIVAAVVVATVWGIWIAPASRRRLRGAARLVLEFVLFGAAAAGLAVAGRAVVGAVIGLAGAATAVVVRLVGGEPVSRANTDGEAPVTGNEPRAADRQGSTTTGPVEGTAPTGLRPAADDATTLGDDPGRATPATGTPLRRPRGRDRARPRG